MTVVQDEQHRSGQPTYIEKLSKKFGMHDCKPVSTPVNVASKLVIAADKDEYVDLQLYQSLIGSLIHVSISEHQARHNLCSWQPG